MQKELVKSKSPRRWMTVFVVLLALCAAVVAMLWIPASNAASASERVDLPEMTAVADTTQAWDPTRDLRCEMVRVWPLPSECLFVFGGATGR